MRGHRSIMAALGLILCFTGLPALQAASVVNATIWAAADDAAMFYINGTLVANAVNSGLTVCAEVSPVIFKERNLLAIVNDDRGGVIDGVAYVLKLRFSDDTMMVLTSEDKGQYRCLYLRERDIEEPAGWMEPGFDDSGWNDDYVVAQNGKNAFLFFKNPLTGRLVNVLRHALGTYSMSFRPRTYYRRKFELKRTEEKGAALNGENAAPSILAGYDLSGAIGVTPGQIDYRLYTHLIHGYVRAEKNGRLILKNDLPDRELVRRAHAAGVKVLLSVGGGNSREFFCPMLKDPAAFDRFVAEVTELVRSYGYDGVDIFWEFPGNAEDSANLVRLAVRLREKFRKGKDAGPELIMVTVNYGSWLWPWIDPVRLPPAVDLLNVMACAMHGSWSDHGGHQAPLHRGVPDPYCGEYANVEDTLHYFTGKGWPRGKLLLTVNPTGYGYVGDQIYSKMPGQTEHAYLPYMYVLPLIDQGWTQHWDEAGCVPYLTHKTPKGLPEILTYENERSVREKVRWARKEGLRGVVFLDISQDRVKGRNVLVEAAKDVLSGEPVPRKGSTRSSK